MGILQELKKIPETAAMKKAKEVGIKTAHKSFNLEKFYPFHKIRSVRDSISRVERDFVAWNSHEDFQKKLKTFQISLIHIIEEIYEYREFLRLLKENGHVEVYSKYHYSEKVIKTHIKKIKSNGGQVSIDGDRIVYYYGRPLEKGDKILSASDRKVQNREIEITAVDNSENKISFWFIDNGNKLKTSLHPIDEVVLVNKSKTETMEKITINNHKEKVKCKDLPEKLRAMCDNFETYIDLSWADNDVQEEIDNYLKAVNEFYAASSAAPSEDDFIKAATSEILKGATRVKIENLGKKYGIKDRQQIKELIELILIKEARKIIAANDDPFDKLVEFYGIQPNLSFRSSKSILLQQYSTPIPISYLAGEYVAGGRPIDKLKIFEPSAGNGMLSVRFPTKNVIVNELDESRLDILKKQGYQKYLHLDASEPFTFAKEMDGVLTNPPFGKIDKGVYAKLKTSALEHAMAVIALDTMKDDGRAAIIVGGHTDYDAHGRVQAGKNRQFISFLYYFYNVEDIINLDGQLYSKQGTKFSIRLILINGRKKKPGGKPPLKEGGDQTIHTFKQLRDLIKSLMTVENEQSDVQEYLKVLKDNLKTLSKKEKEEIQILINQIEEYILLSKS